MSGFGIREQYEVSKQLAHHSQPLWRPASFMQQMSLNGSLLLVPNHDYQWLYGLASLMGEHGRGWTSLNARLRAMPGPDARRFLWQASYQWWREAIKAYPEISALTWRYGAERTEEVLRFQRSIQRTAVQLSSLRWCANNNLEDHQPITVVELEAVVRDTA